MALFFLRTFGCKSNQYETQAIREALAAAGNTEAFRPEDADFCVINTCGVTGRAGASCRNAIRKILRANPSLRLVITGCGVDLGEHWPDLPFPPILVPNAKKHTIAALVADWPVNGTEETGDAAADRFSLGISRFHGHTRAFLKIQDGCDNFCTYCAVPYARGLPESRPPEDILAEARRLVASGHGEIVLTGINIGAYNHKGMRLADVAAALAEIPGLVRLRLGSVEPPHLDENLIGAMAAHQTICAHVHLPMQSGDDGILARMGRRYTAGELLEKVALLRRHLDRPAITTDVIVGFPGEDGAAAEASAGICREAGFSRLHVFLFSARPGTPAAAMRQTATDREIEARKNRLIEVGRELARGYAASCVGLRERVIVEKSGGGLTDRYVKISLTGGTRIPGSTHPEVKVTASRDDSLMGTVCGI